MSKRIFMVLMMTEQQLVTKKSDNFRYILWGLVSLWFVYVCIIVIAGLTGAERYSGGRLFMLIFFPSIFLARV